MQTKKKRQSPPQPPIGFIRQLLEQVRLGWALMRDDRVPILYKLIPIAAIAYVLSPIDFIPDVVPILGQLDDVGIFLTALSLFNSLAPADVVAEHIERMRNKTYSLSPDRERITIDMPTPDSAGSQPEEKESEVEVVEQPRARRSTRKAPDK